MEKADSKQAMEPMLEGKFFNQLKGSLTPTKRDLDLAATNDGFFVISGPWGEGYTRDGRLQTDANGNLITVAGGYSILGKSGPIQITPGSKIAITQTGKILVNDIEIAQLRQVRIKDVNSLETLNGSVFKADAAVPVEEMESPQIVSGYLEAANVNVVESMMEMIYLNKIYNLNTTLVKSRDSNLTKALELGRLQ
jgi:flagellar basal body rod protein FlgG